MIRVTYEDGTTADLPEETRIRFRHFEDELRYRRGCEVLVDGRVAMVETWQQEAERMRRERDAAEKRLADLRAWAAQSAIVDDAFWRIVDEKEG